MQAVERGRGLRHGQSVKRGEVVVVAGRARSRLGRPPSQRASRSGFTSGATSTRAEQLAPGGAGVLLEHGEQVEEALMVVRGVRK